MSDEVDLNSLSNKQVLQGIEDLVREKFGWSHAYVTDNDGAISGMIVGIPEVIEKVKPTRPKGMLQ